MSYTTPLNPQPVTSATDASVASIDAKTSVLGHGGEAVAGVQKKLIYERGNVLVADSVAFITAYPQWTVTSTVADAKVYANALRQIVVESGTTIGSIKLLHTVPVKGDVSARISMYLSQRIANQRIQFGFENATDTNAAYCLFDGVLPTNMKGKYVSDSYVLATAALPCTATNALANYGVYNSDSSIIFSDSAVGGQLLARASVTENMLDPELDYYLVFEIINDATVTNTLAYIGNIIAENVTSYATGQSITPRSGSGAIVGAGAPVLLQNASVAVTGTVAISSLPVVTNNIPTIVEDIASSVYITSGTSTSAAITPSGGLSYVISIPVTAIQGTNPTLDVSIDESDNTGTNFVRVFDFPRITTTGVFRSPPLKLTGNRIRIIRALGGTATPGFTHSVNRLQMNADATAIRQIVDRTIILTTLNSVTPSLEARYLENHQITINIGAATIAPTLILEGSDDNLNFYSISKNITAVANSTISAVVDKFPCNFMRARVISAGTTVTMGYVTIRSY